MRFVMQGWRELRSHAEFCIVWAMSAACGWVYEEHSCVRWEMFLASELLVPGIASLVAEHLVEQLATTCVADSWDPY